MLSKKAKPKLIVLLGPTASGKTALAIKLAQTFHGEIVAADSRTIYRGMDIGTSKLLPPRQKLVRHHLLDIATPDQVITLAEWQRRAYKTINSILKKRKTPFLVGCTGLYISSILEDYNIPQKKGSPRYEALILGISVPRATLYKRINARVVSMMRKGLEKEVRVLTRRYTWNLPALHGIGYREWKQYFEGTITKQELIKTIQQATRNF